MSTNADDRSGRGGSASTGRTPAGLWVRLLALAISLSVSLGFCEVALRIWGQVRNVGPSFTQYDPIYGKRLKKNLDCARTCPEFEMTLSTNSHGFRGPQPPGGSPRSGGIVFLGDSFTLGYGVNDSEEFPAIVRRELHEMPDMYSPSVVNMGLGNSGNGRWLKFIDHEVPKYDPRIVVLQVCGNDYLDNIREGLYKLDADDRLVEMPIPPESVARRVQSIVDRVPGLTRSFTFAFAVEQLTRRRQSVVPNSAVQSEEAIDEKPFEERARARLTHALIRSSVEQLRGQKRLVMLVTVGLTNQQRVSLEALADDLSLPILMVPEREAAPHLYYEVDGHWNQHGHAYVADRIVELIQSLRASDHPPPGERSNPGDAVDATDVTLPPTDPSPFSRAPVSPLLPVPDMAQGV